jgi:hypothetical protein
MPYSQFQTCFKNVVNLHTNENNQSVKHICLYVILLVTPIFAIAQPPQKSLSILYRMQPDSLHSYRVLQPNYYSNTLGFFCKKEWQLEKATKIPFRLRLGSVDYCDNLEGKKKN